MLYKIQNFLGFTTGTILNGTKKPKNKNTPPR